MLLLALPLFTQSPSRGTGNRFNGNPLPNAGEWVNLQDLGTEGQNSTLLDSDVNHGIKSYKKFQVLYHLELVLVSD